MIKNSKRGIFLIYVLFAVALITVFMFGSVEKLQQTIFLGKKLNGENKAFWASEAGIAYAEYRLKQNIGWPFLRESPTESVSFGSFKVTETKTNGGNGLVVHGITEDESEEFCIYFSNKITSKTENGTTFSSIVPSSFPSEPKNLSYCSYSSMTKNTVQQLFSYGNEQKKYSMELVEISSNPKVHRSIITAPGVYVASEGRSGVYRAVTEKMMIADRANVVGAGLYAGGNVNINLKRSDAAFTISQSSNAKPELYCKKDMIMQRNGSSSSGTYTFPCKADNGTIFYGNKFILNDNAYGKSYSSEIPTMKRDYGVNIDRYSDQEFPKLSWNEVKKKADKLNMASISCGTYAAVWNIDDNRFELYYFDKNFFPKEQIENKNLYGYIQKELSAVLTEAKNKQNRAKDYYEKHKDDGYNTTDEDGNSVWVSTYDGPSLSEINDMFDKDLKDKIGGINLTKFKNEGDKEAAIEATKEAIDVFSISDITIDDTRSSIITINKSAKAVPVNDCDSIAFVVMENKGTESNPDYVIKTDVPSDLIFSTKSEPVSIASMLFNVGQADSGIESLLSQKSTAETTTLFCEGAVAINAKISGTGQILSGKYVYAQTGSEINTNSKAADSNSSNISIYANGSVVLDMADGQHDLSSLYERIQNASKGVKGANASEISSKILDKTVMTTDEDLLRISGLAKEKLFAEYKGNHLLTLKTLMGKYYGYSDRESENFIKQAVERNAIKEYEETGSSSFPTQESKYYTVSYRMPEKASDIKLKIDHPSEFSGIIYACGGFRVDGGDNDLTINGSIISYGGNPALCEPGDNIGINDDAIIKTWRQEKGADNGDVNISCSNFRLIYDSSDLAALADFVESYSTNKALNTNLTTVFYNRL